LTTANERSRCQSSGKTIIAVKRALLRAGYFEGSAAVIVSYFSFGMGTSTGCWLGTMGCPSRTTGGEALGNTVVPNNPRLGMVDV